MRIAAYRMMVLSLLPTSGNLCLNKLKILMADIVRDTQIVW